MSEVIVDLNIYHVAPNSFKYSLPLHHPPSGCESSASAVCSVSVADRRTMLVFTHLLWELRLDCTVKNGARFALSFRLFFPRPQRNFHLVNWSVFASTNKTSSLEPQYLNSFFPPVLCSRSSTVPAPTLLSVCDLCSHFMRTAAARETQAALKITSHCSLFYIANSSCSDIEHMWNSYTSVCNVSEPPNSLVSPLQHHWSLSTKR